MSLATRCIACGTVFRVVQDQLKVSEGWVRCGRCGEVFNALEGLFDLEGTSGPTPLPVDEPPPRLRVPTHEPPMWEEAHPAASRDDDAPSTQADTQADADSQMQADERDAAEHDGRSRPPSRFAIDAVDSVVPDDALALSSSLNIDDAPTPGFMRKAESAAQWQRPRVRRALWVAAAMLLLMLGAQVALRERDELAARWPITEPALAGLCHALGCTVEPPRTLDALAVESSGLSRIDGQPLHRLQVALRNRAAHGVAMPAFDLTLTDLRGEVVARRVLRAAELAAGAPAALRGGAEWSASAVLDLSELRVAGYTIELFYP
jgi:predicted Zn finger-like uncharacterized protein